jgi:hypothetical protein
MNSAISISTRDLRVILQEARGKDMGLAVRAAKDIYGPGGSVFIAVNARITERHLVWLEQRNPAAGSRPTYVDVVISQERGGSRTPPDLAEPVSAARERTRKAKEVSREVVVKAEDVARKATEIYRIVGGGAFTVSALRNREVVENLQELEGRIRHFHTAVRTAIDEYLIGNTLIMDLIARHDLATRTVQHSLNVAVFATELASQALLKSEDSDSVDAAGNGEDTEDNAECRRGLAEIFLGGFMHDCGLWNEEPGADESHEVSGANLISQISEISDFLPSLTQIVLFHSDAIRIATKPALVMIIDQPDDDRKRTFKSEFYRSLEEARTAAGMRAGNSIAQVLDEHDLDKVIPVAVAEYCITQTEGFSAKTRPEVISRLAGHAHEGPYLRYVIALCNSQVDVIAPRRAYVALSGSIVGPGGEIEMTDYEAGSMWHTDDLYSPHLITLFAPGTDEAKRRLDYVAPHDGRLWGRPQGADKRHYIPAGRQQNTLSLRVTGFMSEDVYGNILGEYERELKRQMQA